MNVESIREFCLSFPDATENLEWGDDLCFKIRGKIFAVMGLSAVPQSMSLKCTPEKFSELTEHDGIIPAPYVGRYKWIMLQRLDALSRSELKELIRASYEMVAANAPKRTGRPKLKPRKSKLATRKASPRKSRRKSGNRSS